MNPMFLWLRSILIVGLVGMSIVPLPAGEPESLAELRGVWQAHFNADASRVIAQLRGGSVSLWDVSSGKAISTDLGKGREVSRYLVDPKHARALIAFKPIGVQVVSLATGEPTSPILDVKLLPDIDLRAEFSPDGNTVLLTDDTRRVHIFEVESGKLWTPPIPSRVSGADLGETVRAVKFTADGSACFILDLDGTVVRYDARTWKADGKTMRHPNATAYVIGFDVSADGKWAATFDSPGENGPMGTAQMWNVETGERLGSPIEKRNGVTVRFLSKHPGRLLLRGGRGGAGIFELPSGTELFTIREHDDVESPSVKITPDGDSLLSWGPDKWLTLQNAHTGKLLNLLSANASVTDVLFAPDSRSALAVFDNSTFLTQGHYDYYLMRLGLPNASDDSQRMEFTGSIRVLDFIHRTVLSPDGRMLMIQCGITDNERVRIFDTATLKPLAGYRE